jgi:VWFA-related protein
MSISSLAWPGEMQQPATVSVEAQIVHVQVVATDSRGRLVRDLSAGDFTLFDDGRAVPLVAFQAPVDAGVPVPAAQPAAAPSEPASVASRALPQPGSVTLVVYIDNWNLTPADRARVLTGLASFLGEQLARGATTVLVVSASDEARTLTSLTSDSGEVAAALQAVQGERTRGLLTRSDERQTIEDVRAILESGGGGCEDLRVLQARVRIQAQARTQELERTFSRLESVILALGTLKGTKALLYVSGGLEQRPAIDLFHQLGDICPSTAQRDFLTLLAPMQEYDLTSALRSLAARANASRVALYPLDAVGLGGVSLADPAEGNRRYAPSPKTARLRAENLKAGEWILANETGGSAVFNANDLHKPLERIADDLRGAYALGFAPDHEPEGRVHSLRLRLGRKRVRVRYTSSYFHGERADPGTSRTLAALQVGLEQDTLGASVSVDPAPVAPSPDLASGPVRRAKVWIAVPVARLSPVEGPAGRQARVRVVIATWRAGAVARERPFDVREKRIDVSLPLADSAGVSDLGRSEFVVDVPLGPDHREIAVGVEDVVSGLATYRRVRLVL